MDASYFCVAVHCYFAHDWEKPNYLGREFLTMHLHRNIFESPFLAWYRSCSFNQGNFGFTVISTFEFHMHNVMKSFAVSMDTGLLSGSMIVCRFNADSIEQINWNFALMKTWKRRLLSDREIISDFPSPTCCLHIAHRQIAFHQNFKWNTALSMRILS